MALESTTTVAGLVSTNPVVGDPVSEGDDHIRLIKAVLKASFASLSARLGFVQSKAVNYTVLTTDYGTLINSTAGLTLTLTAAATMGNGFFCFVRAEAGSTIIDPSGAELINGAATVTLTAGQWGILVCTGTAWILLT